MIRNGLVLLFLATVTVSVLACGCTEQALPESQESGGTADQPQAMPHGSRDALPEGFPIEIPVMDGEIVQSGRDDGDSGHWFYAIRSTHDADTVAAWYRQTLLSRSWQVVEDAVGGEEMMLVMTKGAGAWSTMRIHRTEDGSRVDCWTGVGSPAPPEALFPLGQEA